MAPQDLLKALKEAAEHAEMQYGDNMLCVIELHRFGFGIRARSKVGSLHCQIIVSFEEFGAANFPILLRSIDHCVEQIKREAAVRG